jgi:hypothetical protein
MYANACGNMAVVSLPHFNVWISPCELAWTYHDESGTWPASDPPGAAEHLARLACSGGSDFAVDTP